MHTGKESGILHKYQTSGEQETQRQRKNERNFGRAVSQKDTENRKKE